MSAASTTATSDPSIQKALEVVPIAPPAPTARTRREARFVGHEEKKTRYHLPTKLDSACVVGYRERIGMTQEQAAHALKLLSIERPSAFSADAAPVTERELFEESSIGILSSRQSTNYVGHRQVTLGAEESERIRPLLAKLEGREADVLEHATHTHLVLSRPYRTPFTFLLTFIGHDKLTSAIGVARRAMLKRARHIDDIPTIGYLQQLHLGILADALERGALLGSRGARMANVMMRPLCGHFSAQNRAVVRELEQAAGITRADRMAGWRISIIAQVGEAPEATELGIPADVYELMGANLMAFRSERIQPGVNNEDSAPAPYQMRQPMDVPDELTVQCGRAAYNAFVHWTGVGREHSKALLLHERIDVLTDNGKNRLRAIRRELGEITDHVVKNIPTWADLPTGKALTRNAARGRKAFALAGQRIYIGGLDRVAVRAAGVPFDLAVRAVGASSARSALFAEIMGVVDLPDDCDLLAGICLMAGPVNQNDIGKQFYGYDDLLKPAFPDLDPTSLLVWTLKAKTVADPIGNEEQLMNAERKGALVELRPGPHDVVFVSDGAGNHTPMRSRGGRTNTERAFSGVGNFVTSPDGEDIPGNRGESWPQVWADASVW